MINTSSDYKTQVLKDGCQWKALAEITYHDGAVASISNEDIMERGISFSDGTSQKNKFCVGSLVSKSLTLKLCNFENKFVEDRFQGAQIRLKLGLFIESTQLWEWIDLGTFFVDKHPSSGGVITLTAYNNAAKFEKKYDSILAYPATLSEILQDACANCGVSLYSTTFPNSDYVVSTRPSDEATTYADIVSDVAQLSACFAKCNNLGQLVLDWYDLDRFYPESGDTVDGNDALTASGNPVNFDAYPNTHIREMKVTGNQTQDGTGDSSFENVRPIHGVTYVEKWEGALAGGRNLLLNSDFSKVQQSSIVSVSNGIVTMTGTVGTTNIFALSLSPYAIQNLRGKKITGSMFGAGTNIAYGTTNPWIGMELTIHYTDGSYNCFDVWGNKTFSAGISVWSKAVRKFQVKDVAVLGIYLAVIVRDVTGTVQFKMPKWEFGDSTTDYSPAPEDLPSYQKTPLPQTLYSLPNGIADGYDVKSGTGTQKVNKKTFSGNESWNFGANGWAYGNTVPFYIRLNDEKASSASISDKFPTVANNVSTDTESWMIGSSDYSAIRILKSRLSGWSDSWTNAQKVTAFKTWLTANPVTVLYELASPVEITGTPITLTASAENTASCDNGGTVEVTYSGPDVLSGGDFTDYDQPDTVFGGVFRQDLPAPAQISSLTNYEVASKDICITGVQIVPADSDKPIVKRGREGYVVSIEKNPLAQDNLDALVNFLAYRLIDFSFRPMTATGWDDPSYEAGDVAILTDPYGNQYQTIISNMEYNFGDYESYSADAESESENQSVSFDVGAKAVQEARDDTERQISVYDQFNELSSLAIGVYRTQQKLDDGSTIYYLHDKPKLSDSQNIWKRNAEGIFISHNGGVTYDAGVDDNGNAKFNMLSAVGVVADWIRCGGSGTNGKFTVKDASDNDMLVFDNRGVTMQNGAKLIGGNGVLSMFISESNDEPYHNGYTTIGWVSYDYSQRLSLNHTVYVPEDFHIVSAIAIVELMSTHYLSSGSIYEQIVPPGWYIASNVQLYTSTGVTTMYEEGYYGTESFDINTNSQMVDGFGTWNPTAGSALQRKSVDVSSYLTSGKETLFTVTGGQYPKDTSRALDQGYAKLRVIIIGYKS